MKSLDEVLGDIYNEFDGSELMASYSERHNVNSAAVLTVTDDDVSAGLVEYLRPRIAGKTVVEIGGGIGMLALDMGKVAKRVYCIEANPMWADTFVRVLLDEKPRNVSYLFGAADEFVGVVKADVAVFCTHSDVFGMKLVAAQFASEVIDVYGELIAAAPGRFDKLACELRGLSEQGAF